MLKNDNNKKNFAQQEGIPLVLDAETTLDTTSLEDELLHNNQIDLDKIELGRQIAAIIDKDTVRKESLIKDQEEALRLYREQKTRIDIQSVQLRIWQAQLLRVTPSRYVLRLFEGSPTRFKKQDIGYFTCIVKTTIANHRHISF